MIDVVYLGLNVVDTNEVEVRLTNYPIVLRGSGCNIRMSIYEIEVRDSILD
jgi:hypothetical protein